MTATAEITTSPAAERAKSVILRWYRVSDFHPAEEWDVFGVVCDALVVVEEQGIVALLEAAAPAHDAITRAVWPVLHRFAHRAMTLTRTPWTGGGYVAADTCRCTSTNPDACTGPCTGIGQSRQQTLRVRIGSFRDKRSTQGELEPQGDKAT